MHYTDRKNQHLGYFGLEHRCKRKYNSLAFKMMELFGLDNAWIVWKEKRGLLGEEVNKQHEKYGSRVCRGKLFRKWAKETAEFSRKASLVGKFRDSKVVFVALDFFVIKTK